MITGIAIPCIEHSQDSDRDGDAEHRGEQADASVVFDEVRRDMQTRAGRDDRDDNDHLRGSPNEHSTAVFPEQLRGRHEEIDPPHAERQPRARDADEPRPQRPSLLCDRGREGRDGAHDALAEPDQHEQTVALGDVTRVPRRAAILSLGEHRDRKLHEREDAAEDHGGHA